MTRMRKLRVLLWGEQFWPYVGGAEIFAARLMRSLSERGFEFCVVTRRDADDLPAEDDLDGIPIRRLPFWGASTSADPARLAEVRERAAGIKRSFAPDLVHLNGFGPTSALYHRLTKGVIGSPYLVTLHGMPTSDENASDSLFEQTLSGAAHVVGCSDAVITQARRLVPAIAGRSSAIRHGIPRPALRPSPLSTDSTDQPRILCLARLQPAKGVDLAISAFSRVAERFPDARLVVAGDGEMRSDLEQQVDDLGLAHSVSFIGWVAPADVPSLISDATLVLMPSRGEGFGLVALEAAFMARPVVATRVGGLEEVVEHGTTGLLVGEPTSGHLAEAVEYLLTHRSTAAEMGRAARKRAEKRFDWKENVDNYESLYRRLV